MYTASLYSLECRSMTPCRQFRRPCLSEINHFCCHTTNNYPNCRSVTNIHQKCCCVLMYVTSVNSMYVTIIFYYWRRMDKTYNNPYVSECFYIYLLCIDVSRVNDGVGLRRTLICYVVSWRQFLYKFVNQRQLFYIGVMYDYTCTMHFLWYAMQPMSLDYSDNNVLLSSYDE